MGLETRFTRWTRNGSSGGDRHENETGGEGSGTSNELERREDDDTGPVEADRQKEDGPPVVESVKVLGEFASVSLGPPADTGGHDMAISTRRKLYPAKYRSSDI